MGRSSLRTFTGGDWWFRIFALYPTSGKVHSGSPKPPIVRQPIGAFHDSTPPGSLT